MKKQDINEIEILDNDIVKVVKTQNNVDIRFTVHKGMEDSHNGLTVEQKNEEKIRRLSKDTYYDPVSRTVKEYKHKEKRLENESTFFRTKRELNFSNYELV